MWESLFFAANSNDYSKYFDVLKSKFKLLIYIIIRCLKYCNVINTGLKSDNSIIGIGRYII